MAPRKPAYTLISKNSSSGVCQEEGQTGYCYGTFRHQGWCTSQLIVEWPKCSQCSGVVLSLLQSPPHRIRKGLRMVQKPGLLTVPTIKNTERPVSTESMKKYTFDFQNFQKYKQEQDDLIRPQKIVALESEDKAYPLINTPVSQIKYDELRGTDIMRDNSNLTNLQLLTPRLSHTTDAPLLDDGSLYSAIQRSDCCSQRSLKSKSFRCTPTYSLNISPSFVFSYFTTIHKYQPLPGYDKLIALTRNNGKHSRGRQLTRT